MIRTFWSFGALSLASLSLVGCKTVQPAPPEPIPARLAEAPDDALRELIRIHIQDVLGPDYIVDPAQLKGDGRLIATDRGRGTATGEARLVPPAHFRLEMSSADDDATCRLYRHDADTDTPDLLLPDGTVCVPVGLMN